MIKAHGWRAPAVLAATGAVCVFGLMAVSHTVNVGPAGPPPPLAGSAFGPPDLRNWGSVEAKKLAKTFADVDDASTAASKPACAKVEADLADVMNESQPAPDDRTQQYFVAMLDSYRDAASQCVVGDREAAVYAFQLGGQARKELGLG